MSFKSAYSISIFIFKHREIQVTRTTLYLKLQQEHLIIPEYFKYSNFRSFQVGALMTTENARDARRWFRWRTASESSHMSRGFKCLPTHSGRHTFSYPYFLLQPPKHNILRCGWWNEVPDIVLPVAETVLSCVFDEASCPRLVNTGEGVEMNQKRSQRFLMIGALR